MQEGFDVGLEMSGAPAALRDMIATMNHGGRVALLGILPDGAGIDWEKVIFHGLTLQGIYGRKMFETWYKAAALLEEGLDVLTGDQRPLPDRRAPRRVRRPPPWRRRQDPPHLALTTRCPTPRCHRVSQPAIREWTTIGSSKPLTIRRPAGSNSQSADVWARSSDTSSSPGTAASARREARLTTGP